MVNYKLLSRLLSDIYRHTFLFIVVLLVTVFQVYCVVYLPVLIGQAVDFLLISDADGWLLATLARIGIVICLNVIFLMSLSFLANKLVFDYIHHLRQRLMTTIHALPMSSLDGISMGDLVSRVTVDTEQLSKGLLLGIKQFLTGILTIGFTLYSMGRLDKGMLLVMFVLTPLSLLLARLIAKRSYLFYRQQVEARGQQTQLLEEAISQISLIQSFNATESFHERMAQVNQVYADSSLKAIFYASIINPGTRLVNALIYAILTGLGAYRIISGNLTVGQLVTFLNYVNQYTKPFNEISSVWSELQSSLACAERLYALLDMTEEMETSETLSVSVQGQITFKQVSFSYDKERSVISDLTLDIPAGSRVAIVGETGAGKSTLIQLLMRFYEVDSGAILIDGEDISRYNRQSVRQLFGMVLQDTWLKEATIIENIAYGYPLATREEVVRAAKATGADFFIQQLPDGYDTVLTENAMNLSEGQKQLLSITRVYLMNPKCLILDEATSSLDTRTEHLIQSALKTLMSGRTSLVIAHRLSTIVSADMIVVMANGTIVEAGTHRELMGKEGHYYQMQMAQDMVG